MKQLDSSADRFVNAVYQRLMIVRAVEQLGLGLLISSAVMVVLLPLARWQGQPIWPIFWLGAVLALLIAGLRVPRHWPSRRDAVVLADRQLRFHELLMTAVSPVGYGDEAFHSAILAQANAMCDRHDPSEVLLRRMGVRSWSALGLVMSMAAVLAIIPLGPSRSSAEDRNALVLTAGAESDPSARSTQSGAGAIVNQPSSEGASGDAMSTPTDSVPEKEVDGEPGRKSQSTAGGGAGSASSKSNSVADHRHDVASGRTDTSAGTTAGGGASVAGNSSGSGQPEGSTATSHDTSAPPNWSKSGDHAPGGSELPDRSPIEDRDLIRDFFSR